MISTHTLPVVIVTGGSRGIGRETVERLARQGRGVLFTHSTSDEDSAQVERACGVDAPVWGVRLDITDADAPARLFDLAGSKGTATALVNNAGVTGPLGPLTALPDDALRDIVEVNLVATARLCREAARRWSGQATTERRDIVNVSSIAARTGAPGEYVVYAATKAAIDALTVGLARELAPSGVHVNAVRAGTTNTTIHARAGDPDRPRRVAEAILVGENPHTPQRGRPRSPSPCDESPSRTRSPRPCRGCSPPKPVMSAGRCSTSRVACDHLSRSSLRRCRTKSC